MDVNVMIDLTERTERAIRDLCAVLAAKQETAPAVPTAQEAPAAPDVTVAPVPSAPVPAPAATPVPAATTAPAPAVPLSRAPTFTLEQVASAGAALIQADPSKQVPLRALLAQYGAPSVAQLPEEHLGSFATELRGLGANI